jgi:hypothetical protein
MTAYFTPLLLSRLDAAFMVGVGVILSLAILIWGAVSPRGRRRLWWVYLRKEFTEE